VRFEAQTTEGVEHNFSLLLRICCDVNSKWGNKCH